MWKNVDLLHGRPLGFLILAGRIIGGEAARAIAVLPTPQ